MNPTYEIGSKAIVQGFCISVRAVLETTSEYLPTQPAYSYDFRLSLHGTFLTAQSAIGRLASILDERCDKAKTTINEVYKRANDYIAVAQATNGNDWRRLNSLLKDIDDLIEEIPKRPQKGRARGGRQFE